MPLDMKAPTVLPHETEPLGAVAGATDDVPPVKVLRFSCALPTATE